MEACFLASNSFTSNSIKTPFHCKRVGIPSSITCCRMDSSPPSNDDSKPSIDTDWRSFRAKLVAAEKSSKSKKPTSSLVDLDTVVDLPQPITVVILVLSTGPLGPSGIILNRPSLMSIKETRSTALDVAGTFSDRPLFFGGPLEEGLFLVRPKGDDDVVGRSGVFDEVMKGLYYGTKESVGCAAEMVKRNMVGLGEFRFFDGYCGWETEQLKDEMRAGYWTVAACSPSVIDLRSVGSVGLWEKVLGLMGRRKDMGHLYSLASTARPKNNAPGGDDLGQ
ncbi:unnamed protein product [Prunus armeniaca]|uniref:Uncharacterized protein n=1 Tax=Prunus armeniaca TaxID=36596 RepID=A0A6J5WUK0_PRUAR|nr:unnamed protein product [Prunus armeniaca]